MRRIFFKVRGLSVTSVVRISSFLQRYDSAVCRLIACCAAAAALLVTGCDQSPVSTRTKLAPVITNSVGMKLALIPAGQFQMGSPDEHPFNEDVLPRHRVRITKPYYMGLYEVTQEEFQRVMTNYYLKPFIFSSDGPGKRQVEELDTGRFPADRVSWSMADEFCRSLSAMPAEEAAGRVYRLPTEAEWEYACRAGTRFGFACGDSISLAQANINGSPDTSSEKRPLGRTTTVGSYPPNGFGLYDMHGNVWEWCLDGKRPYSPETQTDPQGPPSIHPVIRGGAWDFPAAYCRSDYRTEALSGYVFVGFRVVCEVP